MTEAVPKRPLASLGRVLEELGTTLLDVVCGDIDPADGIGSIVIYDPLDEPEVPSGALVLGVGLHDAVDIARVVTQLGRSKAVGLIVRAPVTADDDIASAARRAGVAVLAFARGASWTHLTGMLRSITTEATSDDADAHTFGGIRAGDLFAVANATASLLGAPVTIEDRNSRLLAFSNRQEGTDSSRVQTILSRQVPPHYTRILEGRGVFQEIYRSDRPVFVAPLPDPDNNLNAPEMARAAIAVRAGDEILGTIWVVVPEPLNAEQSQALYDASKLAAMHMVWQRTDADAERRLTADLLSTVLDSGSGSAEAARRLDLKNEPAVVLALALTDRSTEHSLHAQLAAERKRIADAFAMHLSAAHPRSAVGLIGDVAYGVLPLPNRRDADERAAVVATEFLRRVGSRHHPVIGVGRIAADSSGLAASRSGADRALRVLRSGGINRQVARLDDVHAEALLLELAVPAGDIPSGPVALLVRYDNEHHSSLVETLRAWLDAFGDVPVASGAMFVHPNTFRYRLRRVAEVGRIDLNDPNVRFSAMLQLRLMALTPSD